MFPPTRQQSELVLVVDVVVVMLASLLVQLTWDRLEERCHWRRPPGPPQAPGTLHHRRDGLQHCCLPPLQLLSSMLNLMLLLLVLEVLPSRIHLVVELEHRWSGEAQMVLQAVVGVGHVAT